MCKKRKEYIHLQLRISIFLTGLKKASQYANQEADEWFILSAKYFLVHPDQVIEPYDLTLKSMQVEERKNWANRVLQMLKPLLSTDDKLTVLAGKDYRENLIKLFN